MMPEGAGQFSISHRDSSMFAELSGDYNPLHVDPVYSRRLQFGKPVIHGIHHLLRTMEAIFAEDDLMPAGSLVLLSATFSSPVSVGQIIDYQYSIDTEQSLADIAAYSGGQKILSLKIKIAVTQSASSAPAVLAKEPPKEMPVEHSFPPGNICGSCELYLAPALCGDLFPSLLSRLPHCQLAQILACTRVVGMKAPGLHSIFSRIRLDFDSDFSWDGDVELRYFEARTDERVKLLRLGVNSPGVNGTLDTFFRPVPAAQPAFEDVCKLVPENKFLGQRALVIGGSRGVGETTAKILAAGGAAVTITYSRGVEDAQQIKGDIEAGGGLCQIMELDVTKVADEREEPENGLALPTHIYYFASPHIHANRGKPWDDEISTEFSRFYLSSFAHIAQRYAGLAKASENEITVFYPSTAFLDKPEKGYTEYAVTKAAGETLCRELGQKFPNIKFVVVRLQRMSTDQTLSIIPLDCDSVFDAMYPVLTAMNSG